MRRSLLMLALMAVGVPAVTSPAAAAPDPNSVYVGSIIYGGSGCPQGTAGPTISDDGHHFSVTFDRLVARTGPGVPLTENRRFCQIGVNLHVPRGLLAALTVDLVIPGHVSLPAGTTASVRSTAYASGQAVQVSDAMSFSGPVASDFRLVHTVRILDLSVPGPCAILLVNFNTEARITGPSSSSAQLTVDSIDGTVAGSSILALPC